MSAELPRLLYATHNAGKVEEMAAILAPFGVKIVSAEELALATPDETETTFEGNARIKAVAAFHATGLPSLADDSGLCVDALGGAPGVYTADWAETDAGRNFALAMQRIRAELGACEAEEPWAARFVCVLAYTTDGKVCQFFRGEVPGRIVWPPRGMDGHGYDPVFQPDGESRTFAQMSADEKNNLSHRSLAASAFVSSCFT